MHLFFIYDEIVNHYKVKLTTHDFSTKKPIKITNAFKTMSECRNSEGFPKFEKKGHFYYHLCRNKRAYDYEYILSSLTS